MSAAPQSVASFESLVARIRRLPGEVRLVAVDGPAGAGKSTLAGRLAAAADDAPVIHTDEFASWEQPLEWWPRMLEQVIEPLSAGRAARYQRYDWSAGRLMEWLTVQPAPIVVIEGVSSSRREWADRLSFVIWVTTDRDERRRRGLERDGEDGAAQWDEWMAMEDRHFESDHTMDRVDLTVDGNPVAEHDPATQFVTTTSA